MRAQSRPAALPLHEAFLHGTFDRAFHRPFHKAFHRTFHKAIRRTFHRAFYILSGVPSGIPSNIASDIPSRKKIRFVRLNVGLPLYLYTKHSFMCYALFHNLRAERWFSPAIFFFISGARISGRVDDARRGQDGFEGRGGEKRKGKKKKREGPRSRGQAEVAATGSDLRRGL